MYCLNLLEIALAARRARPDLRGPGDEVLRALRADRVGAQRARACGTRRTASTTTCCASATATSMPLQARSVVGLLPLVAVTTLGPETIGAAARLRGARRVVHGATGPRRGASSSTWSSPDARRAGGCSRSSTRTGCAACSAAMLDPDEFLSDHGLRALSKLPPGAPARSVDVGGVDGDARLRAGRVDERPLRRQLELARAGLVPDQLPARRGAARLPPLPRRRLPRRVPDRVGPRADARARSPTSSPAGSSRSSSTATDGRRPVLRRLRAVPGRPGLARPDPVPRVLPRRHRRRPRRLAPDRLDRARRRPDHPPRPQR